MWPDDDRTRIEALRRVVRLLVEQLSPEQVEEVGGQLHDHDLPGMTELFFALGGDEQDLPAVEG